MHEIVVNKTRPYSIHAKRKINTWRKINENLILESWLFVILQEKLNRLPKKVFFFHSIHVECSFSNYAIKTTTTTKTAVFQIAKPNLSIYLYFLKHLTNLCSFVRLFNIFNCMYSHLTASCSAIFLLLIYGCGTPNNRRCTIDTFSHHTSRLYTYICVCVSVMHLYVCVYLCICVLSKYINLIPIEYCQ